MDEIGQSAPETREQALERAVKELGQWLGRVTHGGAFNPEIAAALERARCALRRRDGEGVAKGEGVARAA